MRRIETALPEVSALARAIPKSPAEVLFGVRGQLAAALKDGRHTAERVQSVRDAEARGLDNQ
jgi:hypothetical protein